MADNRPYKFIISGGGTGGHIYPAIAIAEALKAVNPAYEILFVGAEGKMEMEKVPQAGYKIIGLPIRGLQRKLTAANLAFPIRLVRSLFKAKKIISNFKPDAIIGVGGYASSAVMAMGAMQGLPLLIQEQNSYAGLTNKLLSRFAHKICVAYPNMEKYFSKDKLVFTGNPVRKDIIDVDKYKAEAYTFFGLNPDKKTVLVLGGSLGARTINETLKMQLHLLLQADYQVLWQTGKGYLGKIKPMAKLINNPGLIVKDFIYEMNYAYACADVVISRAGALSISEICLAAKPSILVPSPNVTADHQTKNAMALVEQQAAILVRDQDAAEQLVPEVLKLLRAEHTQEALRRNIAQLAKPDAATTIAAQVLKLVSTKQ